MGNFISCNPISRFILCCTLGAFTVTAVAPLDAMPFVQKDINLNDINFGLRMDKLIHKAKKYFKAKDSRKLTDVMFDIKHELEGYTGQKINIDKYLDQVEKEVKSRGERVDKAHMNEMRRRFKKQDTRSSHKAIHMAHCLAHDIPFNAEEEALLYQASITDYLYPTTKSSKSKDKDEEIVLPLRVTLGITMSLIGLFLYVVPFPICRVAAPWVLDTGIAFLIDQGITEWEEKQKEDKK